MARLEGKIRLLHSGNFCEHLVCSPPVMTDGRNSAEIDSVTIWLEIPSTLRI